MGMSYSVRFYLKNNGAIKAQIGNGKVSDDKSYIEYKIEKHFFGYPEEFISKKVQATLAPFTEKITLMADEFGVEQKAFSGEVLGHTISYEDCRIMVLGTDLMAMIDACVVFRNSRGEIQKHFADIKELEAKLAEANISISRLVQQLEEKK